MTISYADSGLVFATRKGTPLDAQNIVNRHFKPLLKRAGLPPIRWHDLRHTCATLLLWRDVHPTLVQHLLGHASITITLKRYSHGIPSMGRHATDGMVEPLGRVYCLRTADKASDTNTGGLSLIRNLQARKRADERTRTAYLCSLRVRRSIAGGTAPRRRALLFMLSTVLLCGIILY